MNIQFMTPEKNGVWTDGTGWWEDGDRHLVYIPDLDEMVKHALCDGEVAAIEHVRDLIGRGIVDGFTFEIVYTAYNKRTKKWEVLQHPWWRWDGKKDAKEKMLQMIIEMLQTSTSYTAWI